MKDISVVVELAVDNDMSDEAIQILIEDILQQANLRDRTSFEVDPHLIEVVAVADFVMPDFEWADLKFRYLPKSR